MRVNISGGTNAGWRDPFHGQPLPWQCECDVQIVEWLPAGQRHGERTAMKTNAGHLVRCPDCGTARPR